MATDKRAGREDPIRPLGHLSEESMRPGPYLRFGDPRPPAVRRNRSTYGGHYLRGGFGHGYGCFDVHKPGFLLTEYERERPL